MAYKKKPTLAQAAEAEQQAAAVEANKIDYTNWKYPDPIDDHAPASIKAEWLKQWSDEARASLPRLKRIEPLAQFGTAIQK